MAKSMDSESKTPRYEEFETIEAEEPAALLKAARRGVRSALRRHKLLGNPIAALQDGKVSLIPPEEI